jgi:hemoglobin
MPDAGAPSTPPSLYDWAGRSPAFIKLIDAFYDRVERDELLTVLFPAGVSRAHRDHVSTWWIAMHVAAPYQP